MNGLSKYEGCGNCKYRKGCTIDNIYKCFKFERMAEDLSEQEAK